MVRALRRLLLLALSAPLASATIAACAGDDEGAATRAGEGGAAEGGAEAGVRIEADGAVTSLEPQVGPELEAWQVGPALPRPSSGMAYAMLDRFLYVLGVVTAEAEAGPLDNGTAVLRSRIGDDGAPGPWEETTRLPQGRYQAVATSWADRLYYLGGYGGDLKTFFATRNADGSLGPWAETTPAPTRLQVPSVTAADGHLYLTGGWDQGTVGYRTAYMADIAADGTLSSWRPIPDMPDTNYAHGSIGRGRWLFVAGGDKPAFWRAALDTNGTPGLWERRGTLAREGAGLVAQGSRLYVVGGHGNGKLLGDVVWTSLGDADGGDARWSRAAQTLPEPRTDHASFVRNGVLYVVGGRSGTPSTYIGLASTIYARFKP